MRPTRSVKLAHLHHYEPELFPQLGKVLLPHDYLTYRMARRFVTDRGDASTTGYWSPRENRWRADVLRIIDDAVDWGRCLPEVLQPLEPAGDREGVLVAAGTGSQAAAALGIGMRPGDAVIALDRSGTCFVLRERLTEDSSTRRRRPRRRHRTLPADDEHLPCARRVRDDGRARRARRRSRRPACIARAARRRRRAVRAVPRDRRPVAPRSRARCPHRAARRRDAGARGACARGGSGVQPARRDRRASTRPEFPSRGDCG